ncbi:hypothetical protein L228DRAFT_243379 [Xylona heveae TC161]|uniref:Uncharacterized protein n=1 Tax=Xylona heveae (strain CBS 132557 / TC161) TaxID=1328760 RepID=A0A165K0J4_XYLHT|nr:hypothetical protein L228DRAFT_243379 [Xylona heveae TC161]KZF26853.1 hypothetical protein L228DRAFT_243379 [Xylona heveae TC161]
MRLLRISSTACIILVLLCLFAVSHAADTGMPTLPNGDSTTAAAKTSDSKATTTAAKTTDSSSKTTPAAKTTKASSSKGALTDLPTLSGGYKYPPPSVPPTANAPFMQHSNLPEGTVFIVVGAALGFLGLAVLAWRGFLAWSLHRSVRRAAMHENARESKAMLRAPGAGFYSTHGGGSSTLSLDALSTPVTKHAARPKSMPPPRDSLFFSPTAGAGQQYAALNNNSPNNNTNTNNRASTYLPAGYYAAGTAHAGSGGGAGGGAAGSSYNLSPSHAYSRSRSSPPSSPGLSPQRGGGGGGGGYRDSTYSRLSNPAALSHESLTSPPQGRAPSAYLEDLFETHRTDTHGGNRI